MRLTALLPSLLLAEILLPGYPPAAQSIIRPPVVVSRPQASLFKSQDGLVFLKEADGSITERKTGIRIHRQLLEWAGFCYNTKGQLIYKDTDLVVKKEKLEGILRGLLQFARLQNLSPQRVGQKLASWHIPVTFDGKHLINPDGSATYFGMMLYLGLDGKPETAKNLSGERLSKALELFTAAYQRTFPSQSREQGRPDLSYNELNYAWKILGQQRKGETPLEGRLYPPLGNTLPNYEKRLRDALLTARLLEKKDIETSLRAVQALRGYRAHTDFELGRLPVAGPPPLHRSLPVLLKTLAKLNGKPLAPQELRALVGSFPMGELVLRTRADELWQAGLTGKGVKVAIIDTGVSIHPDLKGVISERENFTPDEGRSTYGTHATKVAGIVHALAPETEMKSYRVIRDGEDPRLSLSAIQTGQAILQAVHKAVKDGNTIINMSLGALDDRDDAIIHAIDEYSRRGIIFVIAAGNGHGNKGLASPGDARSAITVGALNVNNRPSIFDSYGENFDPARREYTIKRLYMAPGQNIVTTPPDLNSWAAYSPFNGTSAATPVISGSLALLVQQVRRVNGVTNPIKMSRRIRNAVDKTAHEISLRELPSDFPPAQGCAVFDCVQAYQYLRHHR